MTICVKDLRGTRSGHDPLSVSYAVIGGWFLFIYQGYAKISWRNLSMNLYSFTVAFKSFFSKMSTKWDEVETTEKKDEEEEEEEHHDEEEEDETENGKELNKEEQNCQ